VLEKYRLLSKDKVIETKVELEKFWQTHIQGGTQTQLQEPAMSDSRLAKLQTVPFILQIHPHSATLNYQTICMEQEAFSF